MRLTAPNTKTAKAAANALRRHASPARANTNARFFKTGPGQYGEGDQFLGVTVPLTRRVAKDFKNLSLTEIRKLLKSVFHEDRLLGLIILVEQFEVSPPRLQEKIFDFYLKNHRRINNWDLVDVTAPQIVGGWLLDRKRNLLYDLTRSSSLWERRIAIVSTFTFIRAGDFGDTLTLSKLLLDDPEDLLHKACGWMLREVGKRDLRVLEKFLDRYAAKMPRTMLRYSIEKMTARKKKVYMSF